MLPASGSQCLPALPRREAAVGKHFEVI